ncbi:PucR family transcriptional regulator [Streptomyces sp. 7N604]|uniref:PucR family transcriptional regulator n=1 Tax=Streptomyces sp. 7N604 TaxID=3457415 RepID=UPI003FD6B436
MEARETDMEPGVRRIVEAIERTLDQVVATAVEAIWEQVPAYGDNPDERLRDDVTVHVDVIFRAWVNSVREKRPARRSDFPITADQAARRVRQGISLSDFLQAYRVAQLALWEAVLSVSQEDPPAREAALSMVEKVMHMIEVGSSVAAEGYLYAQQHQLAETDRVRRDLLEDLLARRDLSPGPKQAMLRGAGLEPGTRLIVASATPARPRGDDLALRDALTAVRKLSATGPPGLTVVRQDEIVGVAPVAAGGIATVAENLNRVTSRLERQGAPLALGISTVHAGLPEIPEAYAEACIARDGLEGESGVVALPLISSLEYLTLREDETARRLIRPEVRRFVEEDMAGGSALIRTLLEYTASDLNAKAAAQALYIHVNTAYNRLERITERTGCDLHRFADVLELLIAVRLLTRPLTTIADQQPRRTGNIERIPS